MSTPTTRYERIESHDGQSFDAYCAAPAATPAPGILLFQEVFGVNDNMRGWDDDMVAGTVHPIELFEFFHVLRKNKWDGVWQLDQFPFREDSVTAARMAIDFLKVIDRALDKLDFEALQAAQDRQDALEALRLAQAALYSSY